MSDQQKIVDFHHYCPICEHAFVVPCEDPCNECLGCPTNANSRKPINFKEKEILSPN